MIKFEVYRDRNEERKGEYPWSQEDMIDAYRNRSWIESELVASADTEEEALELFEQEKKYCRSRYDEGYPWRVVTYDIIALWESEYDEDGEFFSGNRICEYVAEIKG